MEGRWKGGDLHNPLLLPMCASVIPVITYGSWTPKSPNERWGGHSVVSTHLWCHRHKCLMCWRRKMRRGKFR